MRNKDGAIRLAGLLNVDKCRENLKSYYDTFSKVKIVPWDESSSIEINGIYTPLNWMRDHRKPSGVTQEELEDYTDMLKGKHTRMLVYGRPGIGKTTFCKKAAYDWSKALTEILMNFSILLLIKLRDVYDVRNIRDVLLASKLLASDGPISVNSLYDYMINNQDKVLLILDGYDEYSFAEEHSPILAIWKGEQLRDCHVIVTTRQLECDKLRGPSHVQLEIQGFKSWERKRTYARKFMASEQDCDEFMSYLKEKDLYDMAEIPLLLLMLCILWKEKHHEGLPKLRADIFTQFIQTMLDHKGEIQQPMPFQNVTSTEAKEDLSNLGKAALEALLQDRLYVRCSNFPGNISRSFEKLSEVGLFQIVNLTSLNPEKGAYFIHKSVQEFLAAWHIREEVLSIKGESTPSLSKVESFKKIVKMNEVLKFACELSTEAACAVFHHVGSVGRKESLSKHDFIYLLQETVPPALSEIQKLYLGLISHSYFCCSAEKRRDLCSVFPSYTGGILSLDSNQLNVTANEHLLKSGMIPDAIFFPSEKDSSEKSYRDLITVVEDTDAVFFSCSGEKKAADLLKKFPPRPLRKFFLKRERKIIVYVNQIDNHRDTLPTEMLRELISPTTESTQVKRVGDPLNEHDSGTASYLTKNTNSITGPTPHSLSCLSCIRISHIGRQEMKMLADCLPLFTALLSILISGNPFEIIDAQLTETLVSRVIFTDRLDTLVLDNINLTAKPAAVIGRSLHQAPCLRWLDLSDNPLGEGVSVLTQHLSRFPHLAVLLLSNVKMTRQQVNDLSAAVRQSNISRLNTDYHDRNGNVKPEEKWPTDENWRNCMDRKKSQILTLVTKKSLSPTWKRN
ncbi:NLR family CARD domain-containing protein 4-like [Pocillopora verrucosa]|uniref:NLR family CARD domain-containing protein 4-like n=1 Tax=Pocillopora verrucosa TaxID=203993 RepID=UPI0033413D23